MNIAIIIAEMQETVVKIDNIILGNNQLIKNINRGNVGLPIERIEKLEEQNQRAAISKKDAEKLLKEIRTDAIHRICLE